MVEQNAFAALELSDRSYVLEQGRVTFTGTGRNCSTIRSVKAPISGRDSAKLRPGGSHQLRHQDVRSRSWSSHSHIQGLSEIAALWGGIHQA